MKNDLSSVSSHLTRRHASVLLLAAFAAHSFASTSAQISLRVPSGESVRKMFETSFEVEQIDIVSVIEDEVIDVHPDEIPHVTYTAFDGVEFVDRYVSVEEGHLLKLVRTFEDYVGIVVDTTERRGESKRYHEQERASGLVERVVEFQRDETGGRSTVRFVKDPENNESLLSGLEADADGLFLLPGGGAGGEIEVGSTWRVEIGECHRLFNLLGDLHPEKVSGSPVEQHVEDFSKALRTGLDGECHAKVTAIEDGVVTVEVVVEATSTIALNERFEDGTAVDQVKYEIDGEAHLQWNLEKGRAAEFEFSADVEFDWKRKSRPNGKSYTLRTYAGSAESRLLCD